MGRGISKEKGNCPRVVLDNSGKLGLRSILRGRTVLANASRIDVAERGATLSPEAKLRDEEKNWWRYSSVGLPKVVPSCAFALGEI